MADELRAATTEELKEKVSEMTEEIGLKNESEYIRNAVVNQLRRDAEFLKNHREAMK